ncbi:hypothetical protein SAMN04488102_106115 [Alkalibacterium subtropicum]|uniref:Uncharacterized protein n=1 Tax=Alkalibacterium subtropicum TaxID=753702 RepID=A0A1I1J2N8_9LACT|nr:hypothetical protein SAMN04488102_106115 [Alkalibacterium subtropicum]
MLLVGCDRETNAVEIEGDLPEIENPRENATEEEIEEQEEDKESE